MKTHYIAVLDDAGPDTAVGVWFPDLPGCFSAGDTFEEALEKAPEAASLWLDALEGKPWPKARSLTELRKDQQFMADLDEAKDSAVLVAIPIESALNPAA